MYGRQTAIHSHGRASRHVRGNQSPEEPVFLVTQNFYAIRSYNPASTYALAILHLGDEPFVQQFPGGERTPTFAEVQEIQRRLTGLGFDTEGTDGRVGRETMVAVRAFPRKMRLKAADGYAALKVLARLRQGHLAGLSTQALNGLEEALFPRPPKSEKFQDGQPGGG